MLAIIGWQWHCRNILLLWGQRRCGMERSPRRIYAATLKVATPHTGFEFWSGRSRNRSAISFSRSWICRDDLRSEEMVSDEARRQAGVPPEHHHVAMVCQRLPEDQEGNRAVRMHPETGRGHLLSGQVVARHFKH